MNYYLGEIIAFAGSYVPENFQLCDGTPLSIANNEALYSLIGLTFGGNASTFNVPKMQGLVIVGTGMSKTKTVYNLGASAGANTVALLAANLPPHSHGMKASAANATTGDPKNNYLAASVPAEGSTYKDVKIYASGVAANDKLNTASLTLAGNSLPHNNLQPYITINYMICTRGLYPTPA